MKVLITDDSRVMRQIVKRTLRQAGYTEVQVCEAGDGREALEVIASESPDLVLCDWNMPEMSGIDLLISLRAKGRNVPFGFVTSEGSPDMRQRAENAGALFLIAKPFTPEAFREALEPVLG
jgi:two-component system chemotaxis response regulator CheY